MTQRRTLDLSTGMWIRVLEGNFRSASASTFSKITCLLIMFTAGTKVTISRYVITFHQRAQPALRLDQRTQCHIIQHLLKKLHARDSDKWLEYVMPLTRGMPSSWHWSGFERVVSADRASSTPNTTSTAYATVLLTKQNFEERDVEGTGRQREMTYELYMHEIMIWVYLITDVSLTSTAWLSGLCIPPRLWALAVS